MLAVLSCWLFRPTNTATWSVCVAVQEVLRPTVAGGRLDRLRRMNDLLYRVEQLVKVHPNLAVSPHFVEIATGEIF